MNKFERVLSDDFFDDSGARTAYDNWVGFGRKVEQAVLEKLAEQEPVFYISSKILNDKTGKIDSTVKNALTWSRNKCQSWSVPLYTHPIPCVSNESDKVACVSENGESEDQDLELLKQALESMIGAAHPAHVTDDFLRNKLIKARDVAFKALENHRLNAKERHITTKKHIADASKTVGSDHIPDIGQMMPDGWQPIDTIESGSGMPITVLVATSINSVYTAYSMGGEIGLITPLDGCSFDYKAYGEPKYWMPLPAVPKYTGDK